MVEDRKTFTVPDGFEAVFSIDGRATGEVRPTRTTLERQIAELRAERDDWKAQAKINECDYLDAVKRAEAAKADKARLSEALTEIAEKAKASAAYWNGPQQPSFLELEKVARAALSGSGAAHPVQPVEPLTRADLAEALSCFWNAALHSAHEKQDSTAFAVIGSMAEGIAAVERRLHELAAPQPKGE